jgi:hypothetical protein
LTQNAYRHPDFRSTLENLSTGKYQVRLLGSDEHWSVQFGPPAAEPPYTGLVFFIDKEHGWIRYIGGWPPQREDERMPVIEDRIFRIAERYVAAVWPGFDTIENPPGLVDLGDVWDVYYRLPENYAGGTPNVVIDKRTLKVVRAYHTQ